MKLIYCSACDDVVKIHQKLTTCHCGQSYGQYAPDGLNARYGGRAVPLGFINSSLMFAINTQPESGNGQCFTAFVIPKRRPTFQKVTDESDPFHDIPGLYDPEEDVTFGGTVIKTGIKHGPYFGIRPMK